MDLAEFFRPEKKKFVLPIILLIIFAVSAVTFAAEMNNYYKYYEGFQQSFYEFHKSDAIFLSENGYDQAITDELNRREKDFFSARAPVPGLGLYIGLFSVSFDLLPCPKDFSLCYPAINKFVQLAVSSSFKNKVGCVDNVLYNRTGINSTRLWGPSSGITYPKPEVALTQADFASCDNLVQQNSQFDTVSTKDFTLSMVLAAILLFALSYIISCLALWSYRTREHVRTHLIKYLIVLAFVFLSLSTLFFNQYFGPGILVSMMAAIILAELGVWYIDRHKNYWKVEFFVIYAFFMPLALPYNNQNNLYSILYLPFSLIVGFNLLGSFLNALLWLGLIHYIEKREAKIKHDDAESRLVYKLQKKRRR